MVFLLVITLIFIFLEQAVEVVQPKLGLKQNVLLHWVIADEGGVSDHYLGTYQGDDDGSGGADGGLIVQGSSINGKIDKISLNVSKKHPDIVFFNLLSNEAAIKKSLEIIEIINSINETYNINLKIE